MSKRRGVGEVVLLRDDEEGPYLGRIDALDSERRYECLRCSFDVTHAHDCREWPNVEVLNDKRQPTGQFVYHVTECEMSDPV
jgi:hypothetical protein